MGRGRAKKGAGPVCDASWQGVWWGSSLEVQRLELGAAIEGGMGSIPSTGFKILQAVRTGQKRKM